MESDSDISPKARFKFGFSGKRKRNSYENTPVSSDDFLDSLTRQAASQLGFQEQHTRSLEILGEEDEPTISSESVLSTSTSFRPVLKRKLGHYAIVLMGGLGLVVVWLYSSAKGLMGMALLTSLLQRTGVNSVFANPLEVGIVSLAALVSSLWIAMRRRRLSLKIQI